MVEHAAQSQFSLHPGYHNKKDYIVRAPLRRQQQRYFERSGHSIIQRSCHQARCSDVASNGLSMQGSASFMIFLPTIFISPQLNA
jgi:hypothetical protein